VLGVATLLNLGRSFGILIAFRGLKSDGLYRMVRHPMYATDILLRIGFLINHTNLFTVIVFIISTGCYVYRAILEERFLIRTPGYREYMQRVKYRFIPFVL
jgi:protein-S-isoprenylcysteine O-methyltransferase Ste14